jgi:hypothetical protein
VSVSSLSKAGEAGQLSLFDRPEKVVKNEKLGRARDALEARFGKGAVSRASHLDRTGSARVARRKED